MEHEADALATLYLLASGVDESARARAMKAIHRYCQTVVEDEWGTMSHGAASESARQALADLFRTYAAFEPMTPGDVEIQQASLRLLTELSENRSNRIDSAAGTLPTILWFAVIVGAIVVVGFTLFFGAPNVRAQLAMAGLLAGTIGLIITVTLALDHPFTGDVHVGPEPFERALEGMDRPPGLDRLTTGRGRAGRRCRRPARRTNKPLACPVPSMDYSD